MMFKGFHAVLNIKMCSSPFYVWCLLKWDPTKHSRPFWFKKGGSESDFA